ncbi:FtsX-like permease family protein [Paenibacillus sp. NPDC058071]|uniref:FtsX-like permease family protein n=1 Tax=Paenibacillus sp. NPDC058071 TaxID=3346326 RepID=UPI0036DE61F2
MTFRSLALSNIRGNWRSYSAFFWSSVFSVIIFYIYAAFLFHPDVVSGHILQAQQVRTGMEFCLYIIVIFSFLFVLYSNSAFLKTRKQQFGLLTLFGMTRMQLRKMVIWESVIIALLSIGAGIGFGMLFSKLFFMALGVMLKVAEPIPFAAPLKALGMTGAGFFILFLVIAIFTSTRVGKAEIIDLLKAGRKPKGELVFSKWLVALAIVCLSAAYGMALTMKINTFLITAPLILVTVIIGTYFMFTQLSVLLIRLLQKRKGLFYNRTNMLVLSQLGYKLKDNARILFMVSIMSAVILTASGTFYLMQVGYKKQVTSWSPYTIAVIEEGTKSHDVIDPAKMKAILEENGHPVEREVQFTGAAINKIVYTNTGGGERDLRNDNTKVIVLSATDYNRLAELQGLPTVVVPQDKVILDSSWNSYVRSVRGELNGKPIELTVSGTTDKTEGSFMNRTNYEMFYLIMDDFAFTKLMADIPDEERVVVYGYAVKQWDKAGKAVAQATEHVSGEKLNQIEKGSTEYYDRYQQSSSLTLFIGLFISLLFFIASGSLIYFKLFTELQEDQAQFRALKRIGMTKQEIRRVSVSQIAIIFYIPCVVGTIHALFAMRALDRLMGSSIWLYSLLVVGIFVVMQTAYFLVASSSYLKAVNSGNAAQASAQ